MGTFLKHDNLLRFTPGQVPIAISLAAAEHLTLTALTHGIHPVDKIQMLVRGSLDGYKDILTTTFFDLPAFFELDDYDSLIKIYDELPEILRKKSSHPGLPEFLVFLTPFLLQTVQKTSYSYLISQKLLHVFKSGYFYNKLQGRFNDEASFYSDIRRKTMCTVAGYDILNYNFTPNDEFHHTNYSPPNFIDPVIINLKLINFENEENTIKFKEVQRIWDWKTDVSALSDNNTEQTTLTNLPLVTSKWLTNKILVSYINSVFPNIASTLITTQANTITRHGYDVALLNTPLIFEDNAGEILDFPISIWYEPLEVVAYIFTNPKFTESERRSAYEIIRPQLSFVMPTMSNGINSSSFNNTASTKDAFKTRIDALKLVNNDETKFNLKSSLYDELNEKFFHVKLQIGKSKLAEMLAGYEYSSSNTLKVKKYRRTSGGTSGGSGSSGSSGTSGISWPSNSFNGFRDLPNDAITHSAAKYLDNAKLHIYNRTEGTYELKDSVFTDTDMVTLQSLLIMNSGLVTHASATKMHIPAVLCNISAYNEIFLTSVNSQLTKKGKIGFHLSSNSLSKAISMFFPACFYRTEDSCCAEIPTIKGLTLDFQVYCYPTSSTYDCNDLLKFFSARNVPFSNMVKTFKSVPVAYNFYKKLEKILTFNKGLPANMKILRFLKADTSGNGHLLNHGMNGLNMFLIDDRIRTITVPTDINSIMMSPETMLYEIDSFLNGQALQTNPVLQEAYIKTRDRLKTLSTYNAEAADLGGIAHSELFTYGRNLLYIRMPWYKTVDPEMLNLLISEELKYRNYCKVYNAAKGVKKEGTHQSYEGNSEILIAGINM